MNMVLKVTCSFMFFLMNVFSSGRLIYTPLINQFQYLFQCFQHCCAWIAQLEFPEEKFRGLGMICNYC